MSDNAASEGDETGSPQVVPSARSDGGEDEEDLTESNDADNADNDEDQVSDMDDQMSSKSNITDEDAASTHSQPSTSEAKDGSPQATDSTSKRSADDDASGGSSSSKKQKTRAPTAGQVGVKRPRGHAQQPMVTNRKGRTPSVQGLTIPFRTVKKSMKLDPDIPIVQNEAAIMATVAAELFLKTLARQSYANAQRTGRNTIRYEDVAEARTQDSALSFLEPLLP